MKAIKEIGLRKAIKFVIYSFIDLLFPLFFIPPLRKLLFLCLGSQIESGSALMKVNFFNWHHHGPNGLKIGKDCFIGDQTLIDLYSTTTLGDNVTIAQRVTVLTHINVGYDTHPLQKYFPKKTAGVEIKSGAFVGAGAIILPGVIIGKESMIGAGSVVTSNVPDRKVYGGVPAKFIRDIK